MTKAAATRNEAGEVCTKRKEKKRTTTNRNSLCVKQPLFIWRIAQHSIRKQTTQGICIRLRHFSLNLIHTQTHTHTHVRTHTHSHWQMLRLCYVVKGHAPTVSEVKGVGLAEAEISHCSARVHATFFPRIHNNKRISVNFTVLGQEQKHGKSILTFLSYPLV